MCTWPIPWNCGPQNVLTLELLRDWTHFCWLASWIISDRTWSVFTLSKAQSPKFTTSWTLAFVDAVYTWGEGLMQDRKTLNIFCFFDSLTHLEWLLIDVSDLCPRTDIMWRASIPCWSKLVMHVARIQWLVYEVDSPAFADIVS